MRQLWSMGWCHNRVRVVASSFMVKHLLLPWQWGLKHLWDCQIDADLECDALGWCVAGFRFGSGGPRNWGVPWGAGRARGRGLGGQGWGGGVLGPPIALPLRLPLTALSLAPAPRPRPRRQYVAGCLSDAHPFSYMIDLEQESRWAYLGGLWRGGAVLGIRGAGGLVLRVARNGAPPSRGSPGARQPRRPPSHVKKRRLTLALLSRPLLARARAHALAHTPFPRQAL
jgi:hypothetical protein